MKSKWIKNLRFAFGQRDLEKSLRSKVKRILHFSKKANYSENPLGCLQYLSGASWGSVESNTLENHERSKQPNYGLIIGM